MPTCCRSRGRLSCSCPSFHGAPQSTDSASTAAPVEVEARVSRRETDELCLEHGQVLQCGDPPVKPRLAEGFGDGCQTFLKDLDEQRLGHIPSLPVQGQQQRVSCDDCLEHLLPP